MSVLNVHYNKLIETWHKSILIDTKPLDLESTSISERVKPVTNVEINSIISIAYQFSVNQLREVKKINAYEEIYMIERDLLLKKLIQVLPEPHRK